MCNKSNICICIINSSALKHQRLLKIAPKEYVFIFKWSQGFDEYDTLQMVTVILAGTWCSQWLSARLQYLQCISNGDTAVLHWAIDIVVALVQYK